MILIAESKTMSSRQDEFTPEEFKKSQPVFDGIADAVMDSLRDETIEQLSWQAGITRKLATSLQQMIYEFPNKSLGMRAIRAFTGVVFRQVRPDDYNDDQKIFLEHNLRIISSLYGWLRPDDIIKPYRFDFKSRVAPGGETLMKYWKKNVTVALVKDLQERGDNVIIDLLPADASKIIDWKLVKRFAKVYKADFRMIVGPEETKTPHSGRLKELRGRLLDLIIRERLSSPDEIAMLESEDFMPDPDGARFPSFLPYVTA